MNDSYFLTRQILGYRLNTNKNLTEEAALVQQFLAFGTAFVIADPATSETDWRAKQFGIFTKHNTLRLYVEKCDAERAARHAGSVLRDNTAMVMQVSRKLIQSLVADYSNKAFIDSVCLCGKAPVLVTVQLNPFLSDYSPESSSTIMTEAAPEPAKEIVPRDGLALVDAVRSTLDCTLAADRRKKDPGQIYENFHSLISKLVQTNQIEMSALDSALGLQVGFTKQICTNLLNDGTPKKIIMDYLRYFGLLEYLNIFKEQCKELSIELKDSPKVDTVTVQIANVRTKERFKLQTIRRGKDHNGAYVYQLSFLSESREISTVLSSQFNMVIGKEYDLEGVPPLDEGVVSNVSTRNAAESKTSAVPSEEEEAATLAAIKRKEQERKSAKPSQTQSTITADNRNVGKNRYIKETPEEKTERERNEILGYIIKTEGCNSQDAKRKLEPLGEHIEIVASFAKYIKEGKPGSYALRGYTPKKLMHELYYSPYEAYCMLAELESSPKEALQRLKYRQTDPQYQKIRPQLDK